MAYSYSSAGVYARERDLSLTISPAATSIGAIVIQSNKGPLGRQLITSPRQFLELYGEPEIGNYSKISALAFLQKSKRLWVVRGVNGATYSNFVAVASGSTAVAGSKTGIDDPNAYTFGTDEILLITAENPGDWGNSIRVDLTTVSTAEKTFKIDVYYNGELVESKIATRVDGVKDGFGNSLYVEDVFKNSKYIRVRDNKAVASSTMPANFSSNLSNGSNGSPLTSSIVSTEFINNFSNPDDIAIHLLLGAGWGNDTDWSVYTNLTQIAENRGDAMAIIEVPRGLSVQDAIAWRNNTGIDSSYASIYGPWLEVYDNFNDKIYYVPPSGYVGAIYAYTDFIADIYYAPAGLNRGKLLVNGIEYSADKGQRDALFEAQINPIFRHKSGAIVIFGDKTATAKPSLFSFINVRRYINFLKVSIASTLDYKLFDPNDAGTRYQIVNMINRFLRTQKGHYDAMVKCDDENNPPDVVNNGGLVVDVFIKPKTSVRWIELNMNITPQGVSFKEAQAMI